VPVLAGIIGDVLVSAFGASRHMPTERLGSAGFYRRHHFELAQANMPRICLSPRRTMRTEDISNFQLGA
jgi:hypothetical protein